MTTENSEIQIIAQESQQSNTQDSLFTQEEENCCNALEEVIRRCCPFYKTKKDLEEQRRILITKGKVPVREAVTQQQKALYFKGDILSLWLLQRKG